MPLGLAGLMAGQGALAAESFDAARAAPEQRLEATRGGFDTQSGLHASFGIERSVLINGAVVATTKAMISDVRNVTPAQAAALQSALSSTRFVQNGAGNAVSGFAGDQLSGATVIQNSLDNQSIKSSTILNVTSNGLQFFKGLNAQSALTDALAVPARR